MKKMLLFVILGLAALFIVGCAEQASAPDAVTDEQKAKLAHSKNDKSAVAGQVTRGAGQGAVCTCPPRWLGDGACDSADFSWGVPYNCGEAICNYDAKSSAVKGDCCNSESCAPKAAPTLDTGSVGGQAPGVATTTVAYKVEDLLSVKSKLPTPNIPEWCEWKTNVGCTKKNTVVPSDFVGCMNGNQISNCIAICGKSAYGNESFICGSDAHLIYLADKKANEKACYANSVGECVYDQDKADAKSNFFGCVKQGTNKCVDVCGNDWFDGKFC